MELRRRHRPREIRALEEIADVGVGLEQDGRRKQHVINPDDSLFVQIDVVEKRRAAVEREVQGVVEVVIEVRAGADHEVDQAPVHQLDDASPEARGRQRACHRQADGRFVGGVEHLVREDVTGLGQPSGVERLEAVIDELPDFGASSGPVVLDGLSGKVVAGGTAWAAGRTMRHNPVSIASLPAGEAGPIGRKALTADGFRSERTSPSPGNPRASPTIGGAESDASEPTCQACQEGSVAGRRAVAGDPGRSRRGIGGACVLLGQRGARFPAITCSGRAGSAAAICGSRHRSR